MTQIASIMFAIIHNTPASVNYLPQKMSAAKIQLVKILLIPATELNESPYRMTKENEYSYSALMTLIMQNITCETAFYEVEFAFNCNMCRKLYGKDSRCCLKIS